jgi:uncharacterized phiE125 gp8 family phage protein
VIPFSFRVKTAPTAWAVDIALATAQCKQTTGVDVDILTQSIKAAQFIVEGKSGRTLTPTTYEGSLPRFAGRLWLPQAAPFSSLTHVKYYNESNVLTTLASTVYTLPAFHEPALIKRAYAQSWPTVYQRDDAVQVEWVSGYANAADAASAHPQLIRAMLMLIGHFDENRSALESGKPSQEIDLAVSDLCALDMVVWREPTDAEEDC